MQKYILISAGELGLRRTNRRKYLRILQLNLQQLFSCAVTVVLDRLLMKVEVNLNLEDLRFVPGVASALICDDDFLNLSESGRFAVRARSERLAREIGAKILTVNPNLKVDLKNPDQEVFVEKLGDRIFYGRRKIHGMGGLPIGSSGRLCAILSVRPESIVAALRMMRRGAHVTFVSFDSRP